MNLVLLEPAELTSDGRATVGGARAAHLIDVLRVSLGQRVRVGVVDGPLGVGTVNAIGGADVDLRVDLEADPPPRQPVDVLLALPRPKVMRRLWAQLAALGVDRIMLTNAERVERHYFDTHYLREDVYRPLLIEGLQQAKDTRLPRVSIHKRFRPLIEDELDAVAGGAIRLVAHPSADPGAMSGEPRAGTRALLAVGPEGGWNDFELNLLESRGFHRFDLGPRTLRTDTACVALIALVRQYLSGRENVRSS